VYGAAAAAHGRESTQLHGRSCGAYYGQVFQLPTAAAAARWRVLRR